MVYCILFFMKLRAMIDANVHWCQATEQRFRLPSDKTLWQGFEDEAATLIRALPDEAVVLGTPVVGAVASTLAPLIHLVVAGQLRSTFRRRSLLLNRDVAETHAADVATGSCCRCRTDRST